MIEGYKSGSISEAFGVGTAAAVGFLIAVSGSITMISGGKIIDNVNKRNQISFGNFLN